MYVRSTVLKVCLLRGTAPIVSLRFFSCVDFSVRAEENARTLLISRYWEIMIKILHQ